MQIELSNYQAIALHGLLDSLGWLSSSKLPDNIRREAIAGLSTSAELRAIAQELKARLDQIKHNQEVRSGIMNAQTVAQALASRLDGRQYTREITAAECLSAQQAGLVIVFGAGDDLLEFRGAILDELCGAIDGTRVYVIGDRVLCQEKFEAEKRVLERHGHNIKAIEVEAVWCPQDLNASWLIKAPNSHPFNIYDGSELYCQGVIFAIQEEPQIQNSFSVLRGDR